MRFNGEGQDPPVVGAGSAGLKLPSVSNDMSTSILSSTVSRRMKTPPGPLFLGPAGVKVNPEGIIMCFLSSLIFSRSFAFFKAAGSTDGWSLASSSSLASMTGLNDKSQVEYIGSKILDFASRM